MAKSKKQSKKRDSLEKELLNETINATSIPVLSTIQSTTSVQTSEKPVNKETIENIEDNVDATNKSKKKKKKKKKTPSESVLLESNENNLSQPSDLNISEDMVDLTKKLPEITVIKLPDPVPPDVKEIEDKQIAAINDSTTSSNTSKKKKKKQKKGVNNGNNEQNKTVEDTPTMQDTVVSNSSTAGSQVKETSVTANPSYYKVTTQSHNSPVFLVSNPAENATKQNLSGILSEKTPATITMGPGAQCLIKNLEHHVNLENHLLQQMGKSVYSQFPATQACNFVSLTPVIDGADSKKEMAQTLPNLAAPYDDKTQINAAQKTKAQLKAERRAIQEAQRAAKEVNKRATNLNENQISNPAVSIKQVPSSKIISNTKLLKEGHKTFFSYLPQFKSLASIEKHLQSDDFIHPAIISVGSRYAKDTIVDPNKYCIEVLLALKNVIRDYKTPPNKELCRDLGTKLDKSISFLSKCKSFSVGTSNALKILKLQIGNIPEAEADDKAKEVICKHVDKFIQDSILLAVEAISKAVSSEINDGDVILTYGYSSVVKNALCEAREQKKQFKVIIIDSKPTLEGKCTLKSFLKEGITCSYALMSALMYAMKEVTKVIIGAHAVRASGYVVSLIGTSQIALLSYSRNIPFLVCCESYKFCDRALIDSFTDNELGDPESFAKLGVTQVNVLENLKDISHLDLVNLLYDVTPPHLISKVITEKCHTV